MDDLISSLLHTTLEAASSAFRHGEDESSKGTEKESESAEPTFTDRSTWAEIVAGQGDQLHISTHKETRKPSDEHPSHLYPQDGSAILPQSHTLYVLHEKKSDDIQNWQEVGGGGKCSNKQHNSSQAANHYHKVSAEQRHEFKKPAHSQYYANPIESSVNTEPTPQEVRDISVACSRLWELDLNRLTPGEDYEVDCGGGKQVYEKEDMAVNSLFRFVKRDVFHRPTYARFFALLDNYTANEDVKETVTQEKMQEELAFIEEISRTAPIQYLFKYLVAKGIASQEFLDFKQHLKSLWFSLHGRGNSHGSSCAFEHVFVGEEKHGLVDEVSGFHNWIKFYLEEAAGRLDYQGYILPKRGNSSMPDAHTQCLTIQFVWNGLKKPISSSFVGTSPEFEVALYTLCFYGGREDNYVELGPYSVNIKCYHLGRDKIGSAFPIAQH